MTTTAKNTQDLDSSQEVEQQRCNQSLPLWLQVLTPQQLRTLSTYKHSAGKTTLETAMIAGPTGLGERLIPSFFSANALTLMGQVPLFCMVMVLMARAGCNISPDNLASPQLLFCAGLTLEWFSQLDIMDGLRARRLKVGSPLGRLIDEGGDCIAMANYGVLMAYCFCFDNKYLELVWLSMNIAFYGMEIRYKLTGKLVMTIGEISSVEVELICSILMCCCGYYGNETLQKTFGEQFELSEDSYFGVIANQRIAFLIGIAFTFVFLAVMDDGLGDALRHDVNATLKLCIPQLLCLAGYFALTTVPTYRESRAVTLLFVNYVISIVTLNLMLNTMAGKKFSLVQPAIGLLAMPLIGYHVMGLDSESEQLLTKVLTGVALVCFYGKLSLVAIQWCDFAQTPFWYIPWSKRKQL